MRSKAKRDLGFPGAVLAVAMALLAGCGTTKSRTATEQLLVSDAIDRTVARIDFRPLAGKKVYFDTKYIKTDKPSPGLTSGSADYLISALRQQMMAAGCLLQDKQEDADFIVEGRVGALGSDDHEVTYGIPQNSGIAEAASLVPTVPRMPSIPALSFAKKEDLLGAAKIAVFAYHRQTREPVWQSGVAISTSNAKETWLFGAGPFQYGTIYQGTRFAGNRLRLPFTGESSESSVPGGLVSYYGEVNFDQLAKSNRAKSPSALDEELKTLAETPKLFPLTEKLLTLPHPEYPRGLWAPAPLPPVAPEPAVVAERPAQPQAKPDSTPAPPPAASEPPAAKPAAGAAPPATPPPTSSPPAQAAPPAAAASAPAPATPTDASAPTVTR